MGSPTFFQKNFVTIKIFSIAILILLLLIPTAMVKSLIRERERRQDEAVEEVSSKWGGRQTLAGPVLSIPYKSYFKDQDNKLTWSRKYAHLLPEALKVEGKVLPEKRYRGIYEVVLYRSELKCSGAFSVEKFKDLYIAPKDLILKDAIVWVGIDDMRGIEDRIELQWNDKSFSFDPGIATKDLVRAGVSVRVPVDVSPGGTGKYSFSFKLLLNGSSDLNFIPVGKETDISLTSGWTDPSFNGAFLPDKREISEKGFTAQWKVLHLNRNYPQQWRDNQYKISTSTFGVALLLPVDRYLKSERSVKYAALFISLTFLIFFILEIINALRIHPIQYILVGLGLVLFYVLLLSFSEHIGFGPAYLAASGGIIVLITLYAKSIFKALQMTVLLGGVLVILYTFIYIILQLSDYALLMGSVGLFLALALLMYLTRKVDWHAIGFNLDNVE